MIHNGSGLKTIDNAIVNSESIDQGSLEVKLPTIWTDEKAQPGRSSAMEKVRREKIRDETDQPWRKSRVRRS